MMSLVEREPSSGSYWTLGFFFLVPSVVRASPDGCWLVSVAFLTAFVARSANVLTNSAAARPRQHDVLRNERREWRFLMATCSHHPALPAGALLRIRVVENLLRVLLAASSSRFAVILSSTSAALSPAALTASIMLLCISPAATRIVLFQGVARNTLGKSRDGR